MKVEGVESSFAFSINRMIMSNTNSSLRSGALA